LSDVQANFPAIGCSIPCAFYLPIAGFNEELL